MGSTRTSTTSQAFSKARTNIDCECQGFEQKLGSNRFSHFPVRCLSPSTPASALTVEVIPGVPELPEKDRGMSIRSF